MKLELNGREIKTIYDFHSRIKAILDLPDYYGMNLDALWDCLTGWIDTPVTLVWVDFQISKNNLGDFAEQALSVFRAAEKVVAGFRIEQR